MTLLSSRHRLLPFLASITVVAGCDVHVDDASVRSWDPVESTETEGPDDPDVPESSTGDEPEPDGECETIECPAGPSGECLAGTCEQAHYTGTCSKIDDGTGVVEICDVEMNPCEDVTECNGKFCGGEFCAKGFVGACDAELCYQAYNTGECQTFGPFETCHRINTFCEDLNLCDLEEFGD